MFKIGLLTSTAMTAVTFLLSGADAAQVQTDMHVASRDPNTRFLCTYGQFLVSAFSDGGSGAFASSWTHVAVPVTGHGQTVRRIRVIEASAYHASSAFSAGIYSNTPSGFPGKRIAGGTGRASPSCGPVSISIPATTLKRHTAYWIEETTQNRSSSSPVSVFWEASPTTKRRAYVQHHRFYISSSCSCSGSTTTPWTKQTTGPYLKLK